MNNITVEDFPFVADLPKREVRAVRSAWDELQDIAALVKEKGLPVPQHVCSRILGVSKQRVGQYIQDGRLEKIEWGGTVYVTRNSLTFFVQQVRKNGRPLGVKNEPV